MNSFNAVLEEIRQMGGARVVGEGRGDYVTKEFRDDWFTEFVQKAERALPPKITGALKGVSPKIDDVQVDVVLTDYKSKGRVFGGQFAVSVTVYHEDEEREGSVIKRVEGTVEYEMPKILGSMSKKLDSIKLKKSKSLSRPGTTEVVMTYKVKYEVEPMMNEDAE